MIQPLDLPFPITIWSLYTGNGRRKTRSTQYRNWISHADRLALTQKPLPNVSGPFDALIILDENYPHRARADGDNRLKCVLDWLASREVTPDDRRQSWVTYGWGHAPAGCRVFIRPARGNFQWNDISTTSVPKSSVSPK